MGQWQKIFTKAAKLCSAIHNDPYLVDVNLEGGCSNGLGEVMLHSLLSADELKLERLWACPKTIYYVLRLASMFAHYCQITWLHTQGWNLTNCFLNDSHLHWLQMLFSIMHLWESMHLWQSYGRSRSRSVVACNMRRKQTELNCWFESQLCYIEAYKVNDEIRAKQEKPTEPEKYMYFFHREMKQCPTHSICDIDVTSSCQKFLKMC